MNTLFDLLLAEPLEIEGLAPEENRAIALRCREALALTGRLELDSSAMHELAGVFIAELGAFPLDAVDAFYELRDELPAIISDAEVIDTLTSAASRLGGAVDALDIPELARQLHQKDDSMSSYQITDDAGHTYCWGSQHWEDDEFSPGWDGERWEEGYDD